MPNSRIIARFLANVENTPESTALEFENGRWTYSDLYQQARHTTDRLLNGNHKSPGRVGIVADRSPEFVAAVIGVILADAAFMVLDSRYPDERLFQLARLGGGNLFLAAGDASLRPRVELLTARIRVPCLSVGSVDPPRDNCEWPVSEFRKLVPAYFLFTSGTTGNPKCIAVADRPLEHFINWHSRHGQHRATDRFSLLSGLSHDPVLRDIFTPLSLGAALCIPSQNEISAPGGLRRWLAEKNITIAHLTPSFGRILIADRDRASRLPDLRHIYWGGETLTSHIVRSMWSIAPNAKQTNFYGSTETPQAVSYHEIDPDTARDPLPIGQAVPGFEITVIDECGTPVADNIVGELCVSSAFLSLGTFADGAVRSLTMQETFGTGDFGFRNSSGTFFIHGRRDDQIKIRGYRVSLSEIDKEIMNLLSVKYAITLLSKDSSERLISFLQLEDGQSVPSVKTFLKDRIPDYMVPSEIYILDGVLPLLPNGKVDRDTLLGLDRRAVTVGLSRSRDAVTDQERRLLDEWRSILTARNITRDSSFRSLGSDSLSFVQIYIATEKLIGELPVAWVDMPISKLAENGNPVFYVWAKLDSAIVIRALAIVLIVSYHFSLFPFGLGLTGALFVISGYLFASLKMGETIGDFSITESVRSISRILIPAFIFSAITFVATLIVNHIWHIAILLLCVNLVSYPSILDHSERVRGSGVILWYVDCLLQILIGITVIEAFISRTRIKYFPSQWLCAFLFLFGIAGRFIAPISMHPLTILPLPELSLFQLAPYSNLAPFALGMVASFAEDSFSKTAVTIIVMIYCILDLSLYGMGNSSSVLVCAGCLIFIRRLMVPRVLGPLICEISSASLFIYMSQYLLADTFEMLFGVREGVIDTALAIFGGIAINRGLQLVKGLIFTKRQGIFRKSEYRA